MTSMTLQKLPLYTADQKFVIYQLLFGWSSVEMLHITCSKLFEKHIHTFALSKAHSLVPNYIPTPVANCMVVELVVLVDLLTCNQSLVWLVSLGYFYYSYKFFYQEFKAKKEKKKKVLP